MKRLDDQNGNADSFFFMLGGLVARSAESRAHAYAFVETENDRARSLNPPALFNSFPSAMRDHVAALGNERVNRCGCFVAPAKRSALRPLLRLLYKYPPKIRLLRFMRIRAIRRTRIPPRSARCGEYSSLFPFLFFPREGADCPREEREEGSATRG